MYQGKGTALTEKLILMPMLSYAEERKLRLKSFKQINFMGIRWISCYIPLPGGRFVAPCPSMDTRNLK